MSRAVRISKLTLAALLLAGAAGRVAMAQNFDSAPLPAQDAAVPQHVPNRWNDDEANAQPLPVADRYSRATTATETTDTHDAANTPLELQYPQHTAMAQEPSDTADSGEETTNAHAAKPLPLSRPTGGDDAGDRPARQLQPLTKGAASLGIVVGLFLLVVLVTRRGMPKGTASLPTEVVEVLGRTALVGRQHAYLVRCANKLLLVCATTSGASTLTEITDPAEVENMLELCQGSGGAASTFRHVIGHAGQGPRNRRYAARHQASEIDFSNLDSGYLAEEVRS